VLGGADDVVAHLADHRTLGSPPMFAASIHDVSFAEFFLGVLLAAALSMWVYWHASRHGSRHATAWGIAAFFFWVTVPLYFVHYYSSRRRR
jgi:hypothetical protein